MTPLEHHSDRQDDRTLKHLITHLAAAVPHLLEVKLNKLVYIAHLYHYCQHGVCLTPTRFFSLAYGPHSPAIRLTLKALLESGQVFYEESRTSADTAYSNPCLIIKSHGPEPSNLSAACLQTAESVLNDWQDKNFERILDYTSRTLPFLATTYREHIDFRAMTPSKALKGVLPLPQRIALHRFVEAPEAAGAHSAAGSRPATVAASEVAEIYLALRGDSPQSVPNKDHLGFEAHAVVNAVGLWGRCAPDALTEPRAALELAARLTHALLDSMSFKTYSARVALMTGMLLLYKNGYHFQEAVLEKSWPQSYFYASLQEWFDTLNAFCRPRRC